MKRFVCFLLAIMMVAAMIPAAAVTANAASEWTTSTKAINLLKEYEGFEQYEYQSGGKSYIGYGNEIVPGSYPNGISKEDATELLRKHLKDTVDVAINNFTKSCNLNLTSYQHDALAMFSYNYGTAWLSNSSHPLREAVRTGKSGNEFINIIGQYYGGNASGENFKGLINRRLSEANMYLNNSYGFYAPSNFTYVILDLDGDKKVESTDKVIAYNSNSVQTLAYVPTAAESGCDPDSFLGWYILGQDKDGNLILDGDAVSKLDKNTAGKTLVAKFDKGESVGNASYTINTSTLVSRHVYNKTYSRNQIENYKNAMDEEKKGTLLANTNFAVDTEKMVDGIKWVRGVGTSTLGGRLEGWVYLGELPEEDATSTTPIATATITASVLNIREGALGSATAIGTLKKGTTVNIYAIKVEKTETGNVSWGKIMNVKEDGGKIVTGWINLAYADVKETAGTNDAANGKTGMIVNTEYVNIRNGAGTDKALITQLKKGTEVTVLDTVMNGTAQWGYIQWKDLTDGYTKGWVYMFYVDLDDAPHTSPDAPSGEVLYTGIVTSNINLNVRAKADIYANRVGSLPNGTKVNVYEIVNKGGMQWGRIGDGRWVCTAYLNLTKVNAPTAGMPAVTEIQGTVTANSLNVLKHYNSNAASVGTLKKGDVVVILEKNTETTETGSRIWGRINKDGLEGWINLAYVNLKTVTTVAPSTGTTGSTAEATPGVIANCLSVNVRTAAGVNNNAITKLKNGTSVVVYDRVTKDAAPWARITWNNGANEGWVCLNYVTLNAGGTNVGTTPDGGIVGGTNSNTISVTGFVNNVYLNVRSGAGLGYATIGTLNQGAKVTVFEQMVADGMIWGRINYNNATGWVCMSYITVESASTTGKGVMGTVARCFAKVNVRSAPGTGSALVGNISVGSRVEVFETRQHGTQMWGRVAQGWVCMDYILLDSELPPGTILDATEPTTQPPVVTPEEPDETVNTDGEIAFKIEGVILQDLNVRNDASAKSDRVGTLKAGYVVDIRAVKNNGAELWGRIDQYDTAGWINLDKANVEYFFYGYVNTDEQPIYVDASAASTVKGTLPINKYLVITKVTTDGENVYGWVEEGIFGWIPMSKISSSAIELMKVFKSGETVGSDAAAIVTGTTFASMDAYDSIGGTKVLFKVNSGVTVKIDEVRFQNGRIWAMVTGTDAFYGEYGHAWLDLTKINYSLSGTITTELNVRSSMDTSTTAQDTPNNIIEVLPANTNVNVCQLGFDAYGNLWARLSNNSHLDDQVNGAYVMVMTATKTVHISTVVTP